MENEIWKDIPNYVGYYQVSDKGRVKSIDRAIIYSNNGVRFYKEKIKNFSKSRGYYIVTLFIKSKSRTFAVHKLVAMAFLNHKPCGHKIVVDHKNENKTDNRVENLQLITSRENTVKSKKAFKTSIYTGVHYDKKNKKWISNICNKGKQIWLGSFLSEKEASKYYKQALKAIEDEKKIKVKKHKPSSKFKGVSFNSRRKKWEANIQFNNKKKHLGIFNTELEAHHKYENKKKEYESRV